jgi:RNA polymerase sigma-70 factor (ECF subfamily)
MDSKSTPTENSAQNPEGNIWLTWLEEHGDYLLRLALARVHDRDTAEDLVQETLVAAVRNAATHEGRSSVRAWLGGILRHKILDHFREVARTMTATDLQAQMDPDGEFEDHFFESFGHWKNPRPKRWQLRPDEMAQEQDFLRVLRECLTKLPGLMSQVFILRDMDEVDSQEVCETLGISEANLYTTLHRARFRLRRCIEVNWFNKSTDGGPA